MHAGNALSPTQAQSPVLNAAVHSALQHTSSSAGLRSQPAAPQPAQPQDATQPDAQRAQRPPAPGIEPCQSSQTPSQPPLRKMQPTTTDPPQQLQAPRQPDLGCQHPGTCPQPGQQQRSSLCIVHSRPVALCVQLGCSSEVPRHALASLVRSAQQVAALCHALVCCLLPQLHGSRVIRTCAWTTLSSAHDTWRLPGFSSMLAAA